MKPAIIRNPEEGSGGDYAHPRGCTCGDPRAHPRNDNEAAWDRLPRETKDALIESSRERAERRSGNERRTVPRWIEYTRADDRRGKALDHS